MYIQEMNRFATEKQTVAEGLLELQPAEDPENLFVKFPQKESGRERGQQWTITPE